ncbi:hypothetical protein Pint_12963 [Pistacia integerrima]|uniref:Uncharacterized protein n=1 Tax=Pistacia integerrima TaxID=434235 RepID=A0ACC0Y6V9_9ROSI|nr:hypothetical protein Pint_12963 [Pistacia integerrima]
MKKSASAKSAFSHFEEEDIVETRRPATTKEGKAKVTQVVDDEVDAKADDFIYKFKQQLKLQRIDSIIRSTAYVDEHFVQNYATAISSLISEYSYTWLWG